MAKKDKRTDEDELLDMLNDNSDESDESDEEDDGYTEDQINAMKKKGLLALIEEEGLDVDEPEDKSAKELRALVIEEYFDGEEGEDEIEDESDEEAEEDDGYSEEDIRKMTKATLYKLIEEEALEIEGAKSMKAPELKDAVVAAYFDEGIPSEDEINAMSKGELSELIEERELDVDTSLKKKKLAAAVIEALSQEEEPEEEPEEEEEPEPEPVKPKKQGKKNKKAKGLSQELPIKTGSKRAQAIMTMMEKSRTLAEHQAAAEKAHKKAKGAVRGNADYKTVMDRNLVKLVREQFGGVYEEDTDDGSFILLGFDESQVAEKPAKPKKTEKPAEKKQGKKGGKKSGKKGGKKKNK